jgi:hypothetical protein
LCVFFSFSKQIVSGHTCLTPTMPWPVYEKSLSISLNLHNLFVHAKKLWEEKQLIASSFKSAAFCFTQRDVLNLPPCNNLLLYIISLYPCNASMWLLLFYNIFWGQPLRDLHNFFIALSLSRLQGDTRINTHVKILGTILLCLYFIQCYFYLVRSLFDLGIE